MLVSWDEHHATGYEIMDAGHRLVIETINRLNAATTPSQCQAVVDQMLAVLMEHLTRQFEHEDALLARNCSAERDEHTAEHRHVMAALTALKNTQGRDVPDMLLLSLIAFLAHHLRGTDRIAFPRHTLAA